MYVDTATITRGNKTYKRHLLRVSYRDDGKVKHKTLLNLSVCSDEEIAALKLALKHKRQLTALASLSDIETRLGKSLGAVWALKVFADRIGVASALGSNRSAKLALMQVIARVMDQGSRLSAVRFAMRHAVCEVLGIDKLNEDDLYENLAWLANNQERIEKKLFKMRFPEAIPTLFLYDVTSSYVEGTCNELARFGYNRDKKRGKKQIVIGLLTGPDGLPIAVRVFEGNASDSKTVTEQVRILAKRYGVKEVTLVGDRGMLKGPQLASLPKDFRYITAITKPQIRTMLSQGTLQYDLFSDFVCEVEDHGVRYVCRRNPVRAEQLAQTRQSKKASIEALAEKQTHYLADHPRAKADTAVAKVAARIKKLKANGWLTVEEKDRELRIHCDEESLAQAALLDGCYVVKSDVTASDASAQTLHDRYCDLQMVERAFRTAKTTHLELRPVFVTKKSSTQGHVFIVMLALLLQRELERYWAAIDVTVEEGLEELASIRLQEVELGTETIQNIPRPTALGQRLLDDADVVLPSAFPNVTADVHTKHKLPSTRKQK